MKKLFSTLSLSLSSPSSKQDCSYNNNSNSQSFVFIYFVKRVYKKGPDPTRLDYSQPRPTTDPNNNANSNHRLSLSLQKLTSFFKLASFQLHNIYKRSIILLFCLLRKQTEKKEKKLVLGSRCVLLRSVMIAVITFCLMV